MTPSEFSSFVAAFVQRLDAGATVSDLQRSLKHKLKIKIIQSAAHPSLLSSLGVGELLPKIPPRSMRPTLHYFVIALSKSRATQPIVVPAVIPFLPAISPFHLRRSLLSLLHAPFRRPSFHSFVVSLRPNRTRC